MQEKRSDADIVIVGGGMVGLSLALMFAHHELASRIVVCDSRVWQDPEDEQLQPSFDMRVTAVSAGSAALFEQLDLWRSIAVKAQPIASVKVSDRHRVGSSKYDADARSALGYVVENSHISASLKRAVIAEESIEVRAPVSVDSVRLRGDGAQITLNDARLESSSAEAMTCSLLILADGAASPLAASLGIRFSKREYHQCALVCNVSHSLPHENVAFERFTESGPLALLPLRSVENKHRSALVWTHSDTSISSHLDCSEEVFLSLLKEQFSHRLGDFIELGKRDTYPLNLISADEQIRRNLVLMGNAAHLLHPVAGQGFNLALRDCAVLANSLKVAIQNKRKLGELADLQSYLQLRMSDQLLTTELSHQFISVFGSKHPLKRLARASGLTAMNKLPAIKSLFFEQMMGQGFNRVALL